MEIELLQANIGDAKRITCHAGIMRRKRSGYVEKCMEMEIGNVHNFAGIPKLPFM